MAIMNRVLKLKSKSSSMETKNSEDPQEPSCVVCFKGVYTYSIGLCDHPVCFECSTRMRVICRKFECPICRQDMPTVYFTKQIQPFKFLKNLNGPTDPQSKIVFESEDIKKEYASLLEHRCPECPQPKIFQRFEQLRDHVKRSHTLFYCDLCVDNLKIFTRERRVYSRVELASHRKKGDPDDKSHRGHPLCEFCEVRYVDVDELYRHLRKDHLFCHICDSDGFHGYYNSYGVLRDHFRAQHFLCEEGDCSEEKFTSVFRTEIDLRAHRASEHGRNMGKSELKQARTLNLEFSLAPRPRAGPSRSRQHLREEAEVVDGMTPIEEVEASLAQQVQQVGLNTACPDAFPSLTPGAPPSQPILSRGGGRASSRAQGRSACYEADFPALTSNAPSRPSQTVQPPSRPVSVVTAAHVSRPAPQPSRPATSHQLLAVQIRSGLGSSGGNKKTFLEDFPALSPLPPNVQNMAPVGSQWAVAPRPVEPKVQLVARPVAPKARPQAFQMDSSQFPSLGGASNPPPAPPEPRAPPPPRTEVRPVAEPPQVVLREKEKQSKKKKKGKKEEVKHNANNVPSENNNNITKNKNKNNNNNSSSAGKNNSMATPVKNNTSSTPVKNSTTATPVKNNTNTNTLKNNTTTTREVKNSSEFDFGSRQTSASSSAPPGFSSAPPGFVAQRRPPGLAPPIRITSYTYLTPRNFTMRNEQLLSEVVASLSGSDRLDEFRSVSSAFQAGSVPAAEYVSQCSRAMGRSVFENLFPELLALLPDIEKQKELWKVVDNDIRQKLEQCDVCQQVVVTADIVEHAASHTAQLDFPPLGYPPLSRPVFQSQST